MEYKIVPFLPITDLKRNQLEHVANQLQEIVNNYTRNGWDYVRVESITTYVKGNSGCLGFGASGDSVNSNQMIVFRK